MKSKATKVLVFTTASVLLLAFQNCSKMGTNGIAVEDKVLSLEDVTVLNPPVTESTDAAVDGQGSVADNTSSEAAVEAVPEVAAEVAPETTVEESTGGAQGTPVAEMPQSGLESAPVAVTPALDEISAPAVSEEEVVEVPKKGPVKISEVKNPKSEEPPAVEDDEVAEAVRLCSQASEGGLVDGAQLRATHNNLNLGTENLVGIRSVHSHVLLHAQLEGASVGDSHITHGTLVLCNYDKIAKIKGEHTRIIILGGEVAEANLVQSTLVLINATVNKSKGARTIIKTYSLQ